MAKKQVYEIRDGYVTTTDGATPGIMAAFNISTDGPGGVALNNCSILAYGNCTGFDTTSNAGAGERIAAVFKVVSGTLTQVGSTLHVIPMIDDVPATPDTEFSISGTTIQYQVVGSTGETIEWFGRLELTIYQPT